MFIDTEVQFTKTVEHKKIKRDLNAITVAVDYIIYSVNSTRKIILTDWRRAQTFGQGKV